MVLLFCCGKSCESFTSGKRASVSERGPSSTQRKLRPLEGGEGSFCCLPVSASLCFDNSPRDKQSRGILVVGGRGRVTGTNFNKKVSDSFWIKGFLQPDKWPGILKRFCLPPLKGSQCLFHEPTASVCAKNRHESSS